MKFMFQLFAVAVAVIGPTCLLRAETKESSSDEKFLKAAASGGMLEVKLGELAAQNAAATPVRQFAKRIVEDHTQANKELMAIAEKKGIAIPMQLQAKDQETYDKLKKLQGAEFDRAYMKRMVADHEEDIAKFNKVATAGKDEQTKEFASKTLPTLKEHLKMAREVAAKVGAGQ